MPLWKKNRKKTEPNRGFLLYRTEPNRTEGLANRHTPINYSIKLNIRWSYSGKTARHISDFHCRLSLQFEIIMSLCSNITYW